MPTNAQKRLSVPSFAEIGTRVALRLIFATWSVINGVVGIMQLALHGDNHGANRREMKSLVFLRQHPADMATPFCHQVRHEVGSDSNTLNILLLQTEAAIHW